MQDSQMWGWFGGVIVILLGGGLIGAYITIRNTSGPRERKFIAQFVIVSCIATAISVGLHLRVPETYKWLVWLPYYIFLPFWIRYSDRRLDGIRQEEAADDAMKPNGESGDD